MKLPQETGTKPSQRSLSAAAVLVNLPELERNTNSESRAAHGQLQRLLSKDEASLRDAGFSAKGNQQEASRERPSESRAASLTTPENDCSDPSTFSWEVRFRISSAVDNDFFLSVSQIKHIMGHWC